MADSEHVQSGKSIFQCHAGIDLTVSALSFMARQQIQAYAQQQHPYPDPKQFERLRDEPIFGGNAEDPGVIPASENEEYQDLWKQAKADQDRYVNDSVLAICVNAQHKERLIKEYQDELSALRIHATNIADNDWSAIVKCFLCSWEDLRDIVYPAISQSLPLSQEETVANGIAFFRQHLPQRPANGRGTKPVASGATSSEPVES